MVCAWLFSVPQVFISISTPPVCVCVCDLLERESERGEQVEDLEGQPADAEHEDDHEEHLGDAPLVGQDVLVALLVRLAGGAHPPQRLRMRHARGGREEHLSAQDLLSLFSISQHSTSSTINNVLYVHTVV